MKGIKRLRQHLNTAATTGQCRDLLIKMNVEVDFDQPEWVLQEKVFSQVRCLPE
jgi:hypothetical protein